MKNDLEKKNNFIHFLEKWVIIGVILFIIVQLGAGMIIHMTTPKEQQKSIEEYDKDYIGHWYNGTFFINMTVKENFESQDKYDEMIEEQNNNSISNVCSVAGGVFLATSAVLLLVAAFRERKKKLVEGNTPLLIILGGVLLLIYKIIEEIDLFIDVSLYSKYSKGFLSTVKYYPQMHYIFIIPVLLILMGLMFRQIQRKNNKLSNVNNEKIIKTICISILVIGLSFILYRFGIRVYELISNGTIRIPFYYYIMDLPKSYASSISSYNYLVVLRFIKDLPVFIASIVSIILFVKIILSSIKGTSSKEETNNRYKIIFISLLVASLVFNILGLLEVKLLNSEFLYQYKEAVYTIAIRSLTEPLFYGFFIYLFKHYIELGYECKKERKK